MYKRQIEIFSGDIEDLIKQLSQERYQHAYIDGGVTITHFLNKQLINEVTITQAPVLLGSGKQLFGKLTNRLKLTKTEARVFPNDFVQIRYLVDYD